jgi:A/G-specific adenine glycosylase
MAMAKQCVVGNGEPFLALREALEARKRRIQEGILTWAANNLLRYPWRKSGKTPYEVLIGEAWLKQTSSVVAVRVYQRFLQRFLSIKALAEAEADEVASTCCKFGLERPAQNIKMMVRSLLKEGNGDLPKNSDVFARASGLGHQCVKCIFCFGYGMPIAVVDANIARTLSRLFNNTLPSPPAQGLLQAIGENLLPVGNHQIYNSGFMDLAELICRNENPLCPRCPIGEACDYAEALPGRRTSYPAMCEHTSV